jgi:phosphoglycolate phosphatase-like HAD superfamily hydrolase
MATSGVVFDLDDTLVDTQSIRSLREERKWALARSSVSKTLIFPGIAEIISLCEHRDLPVAVVTNSPSVYALAVLEHHGLTPTATVCYHDTKRHKPHPDPILHALEISGIDAEGAIGVGDSLIDHLSYQSAGLVSVGAGWSPCFDDSAEWNHVCDRTDELPGIFFSTPEMS